MFQGYNKKPRFSWYPRFDESGLSIEEAVDTVDNLLLNAVSEITKNRKIGILIGGLDSSLLVAIYRKLYPSAEIRTYTAGFDYDDESVPTSKVANLCNTEHKIKRLTIDDFIGEDSLLRPLILSKHEPLHPNEIALCNMEILAKQDGCDLVLCGEGADDIFGGYTNNWTMHERYTGDKPFFEFFLDNYRYFSLEDRFIINEKYLVSDVALLNRFIDESHLPVHMNAYGAYFTQQIHTPGLIARGINAAKVAGIDIAFPYITYPLVEFTNRLPMNLKINGDEGKYVLKRVAERYLPKEIVYRKKHPFPVPFDRWLAEINEWDLNREVFTSKSVSDFNGWKKFMLINLNTFVELHHEFDSAGSW